MKTTTQILLSELKKQVQTHIDYVTTLKEENLDFLQYRNSSTSWNILECIEHLNLYGDYYLPEIEKVISKSKFRLKIYYTSGWLGDYFAKSMLLGAKTSKMKTFKDKNPLKIPLDKTTIDRFLNQQKQLLDLLKKAESIDLEKEKIKISIARCLSIQLGDSFRFIINHDERHIVQCQKIIHKLLNIRL
ncbi:hypothetical protein FCOL_10205 [Flavobacterium columnare ATCC 49512]|uniref:DinB-like domain-containing protein n=1 Tax=Flavobacterium columnare (strain ATCC 49512 / CIP 103533 / TG 44/87) TaxID=1041826 RepID=G8X532_FLACA|nr:DinB family protein [Flavobacterium columnare]AEW86848.1 hypothetical protein FCOL_10205 [Flavobacterium columnare ATCC 49512]